MIKSAAVSCSRDAHFLGIMEDDYSIVKDKISDAVPPSVEQATKYLELLKEQALKRKLKEVAQNISGYIETPPTDNSITIETFTNRVIQDVRDIQKSRTTKNKLLPYLV